MAAPAVVGTASGGIAGSGSFTVTPPAGGSGYVALCQFYGTAATQLTAPSGWTLHEEGAASAGSSDYTRYAVYIGTSVAGSSWNHGNASEAAAVAVVGFDGAPTVHQSAGASSTGVAVCPSVTTTEAARILRGLMIQSYNATPSIGYPASHPDGQVTKSQTNGGVDFFNAAAATVAQGSGGATGTATFTSTAGVVEGSRAVTLALTTAGGAAATSLPLYSSARRLAPILTR